MTVAIMQPYIFPYIGYFQLIEAVDVFVFYDDVNFIKKGWINRNKILSDGSEYTFTIPLAHASQNKKINELSVVLDTRWKDKFYKHIVATYSKAPYFDSVFELVKKVIESKKDTISELAIFSMELVSTMLGLSTKFLKSSAHFSESTHLKGAERLISICKTLNAQTYINPIGGQDLYDKSFFLDEGISLYFLKSDNASYQQFGKDYVPWLSIIDVLMFNSKDDAKKMLTNYHLI